MKLKGSILAMLVVCCLLPLAQAKCAPNLELTDQAGKTHKISELRGSIVVVNFWATWCGPCREELPMLTRLSEEYGEKKVRFVAISADEWKNRAVVEKFATANHLNMEICLGADLDMLERANLGNVLPATLILDQQGDVIARVLGQAREEDIRKPLDWLLAGKNGLAPKAIVKHYRSTGLRHTVAIISRVITDEWFNERKIAKSLTDNGTRATWPYSRHFGQ